jgi:hypothetical protein
MYAAVPSIAPGIVGERGVVMVGESPVDELAPSAALASPKSSTFALPSGASLMLSGFRSRWMMPASCAASTPEAISTAISSASVELGERPRLALEAGQPVRVGRELVGQRLDRDGPVEPRVAAEVDDAHPSAPDLAVDGVRSDAGSGARRHGGSLLEHASRRLAPRSQR